MRNYTDSVEVVHHEDGSRTETSVVTYQPVTKAQQATALLGLTALIVAPLAPLAILPIMDRLEDRRARKAAAKKAKLTSV